MHARSVMSNSVGSYGLQLARLLCSCYFPGRNTEVGCHFLLQGIFPTQGLNPCLLCLLHWQTDSLLLSHLGSPVDSFTKWPICTACKNVLMAIFLYAWLMWWLGQQWWLPSVDLLPADLQKAGPARVVLMNPSTELRGGSGITLHCREKKPTDQWYCCCCC